MLIDFEQVITTLTGSPLRRPGDYDPDRNAPGPEVPTTLRYICVEALLARSEKNLSGDKKAERFELAMRINEGGKIDLKAEDVALIKKLVASDNIPWSTPLVVGRAFRMLEGKS